MQDDYRNDPTPADTRSLGDYIKKPAQGKKKGRKARAAAAAKPTDGAEEMQTVREQLGKEFWGMDSALVAAIVADHAGDAEGARKVLMELG